jgi:hypothetical protein
MCDRRGARHTCHNKCTRYNMLNLYLVQTLKIKPWNPSQGFRLLIHEASLLLAPH